MGSLILDLTLNKNSYNAPKKLLCRDEAEKVIDEIASLVQLEYDARWNYYQYAVIDFMATLGEETKDYTFSLYDNHLRESLDAPLCRSKSGRFNLPVALAAGKEKDCAYYLLASYTLHEGNSLGDSLGKFSWTWIRHRGCRMDYWNNGTWTLSEEGEAVNLAFAEDTRKNGRPIHLVPVYAYRHLYCMSVLAAFKASALRDMFASAYDLLAEVDASSEGSSFSFSMDKEKLFDFLYFYTSIGTSWVLPCFFTASIPYGKKYQAKLEILPFSLVLERDQLVKTKIRMTLSEVRKDGTLKPLPEGIMLDFDWEYISPKYVAKNPPEETQLLVLEGLVSEEP